uniref:Uncharacterized protein n=1 Tax=Oryza sativa subsp. japonica TaxID=39947 RepID=Q6K3D0_ORYSJ|nr:hypothetical protein [Oryza sativa Japonica Group]BAD28557.1 hypothetical protein [Oryza sativa Japonica Group]
MVGPTWAPHVSVISLLPYPLSLSFLILFSSSLSLLFNFPSRLPAGKRGGYWRCTTEGLRPDPPKPETWAASLDRRQAAKVEKKTIWAKATGQKLRLGTTWVSLGMDLAGGPHGRRR